MKLEELRVYNQAIDTGEEVWEVVIQWNYFAKDTVGKQLVKAADSIAANISEGYGRYHFKDTRNFLYYSRGSLNETKTWLLKAYKRKLIDETKYNSFNNKLKDLGIKLNNYINTVGKS
jgi:four helix bundle protein